ncbi:MAG: dephospho-CoA kinase [Burkholderiales bacterium]|nr:dephospho-CoA kinase [Burkholderiales bacterium]
MQYIIGLTGLLGSGKSQVSKIFSNLGISIIDTDIISRAITNKGGRAIAPIFKQFGADYIDISGDLNRNKMRELVFTNRKALIELETILHPLIFDEVLEQLRLHQDNYVIVVVPLLFKSLKYLKLIHRSVFVNCSESILIDRVVSRNNLTKSEIQAILNTQMPANLQLALCDDVLDNNCSIMELTSQVISLDKHYQELFMNRPTCSKYNF